MNASSTKARLVFLIEFLKWYFLKYWQVRTRQVFAQTVTYYSVTAVTYSAYGLDLMSACGIAKFTESVKLKFIHQVFVVVVKFPYQ